MLFYIQQSYFDTNKNFEFEHWPNIMIVLIAWLFERLTYEFALNKMIY